MINGKTLKNKGDSICRGNALDPDGNILTPLG
jgi:hypothetical protein